jgi:hypothetical protein
LFNFAIKDKHKPQNLIKEEPQGKKDFVFSSQNKNPVETNINYNNVNNANIESTLIDFRSDDTINNQNQIKTSNTMLLTDDIFASNMNPVK